ncbi:hypothetical protein LEP1GSC060_3131 [Leptospira weilii serovar Ranarum str. ICFT]|uniref:Uncharacterized protein n=1 Tax=Leptospira weilii serovar Ranarum str. ICFT TaxID=1218598 RepID=N1WMK4_9LEPT|nr:hypothetical protein LEP1GSC060_3131 [Leptospira weilii serovar Ranarum str. ICFT]
MFKDESRFTGGFAILFYSENLGCVLLSHLNSRSSDVVFFN